MFLKSVCVTNFKSIVDSGNVPIDRNITVLVGQNESGKTAFLQALYQTLPVYGIDKGFDRTTEYPRHNINKIKHLHPDKIIRAANLSYTLEQKDIERINKEYGVQVIKEGTFGYVEDYEGSVTIFNFDALIDEVPLILHIIQTFTLTPSIKAAASLTKSIKELLAFLKDKGLTELDKKKLEALVSRFNNHWNKRISFEVYVKYIKPYLPKFFYFDEYKLLPSKTNLKHLQTRVTESNDEQNPKALASDEQAVLALLQMAGISLDDVLKSKNYEEAQANIESSSNNITDQFLKYWTQNPNLEIVIDIDENSNEPSPFNDGPNLHVRIKNKQHRVTLPFNQRSKGFIWFFSFLVWFDNIQTRAKERGTNDNPIILLLDEPGLNLHALAQANLLAYIDTLAKKYQVIYTTHSPFMVHTDRLEQVRVVENKDLHGTKVSDHLDDSDPASLFPLQAALGYTIAQNLFISKRNLIVEGIADLTYLQYFSQACEAAGKESLRADITLMPVGGIDKIPTFVSLLGANQLELVVLHDYSGKPEAKLDTLVREKILHEKDLLTYAAYRNPTGKKPTKAEQGAYLSTDVEDLFSLDLYLKLFSETFKDALSGKELVETDLQPGDRVVERLERWLAANKVKTRQSDGYNHYTPAKALLTSSITIDSATLDRFAALFKDINKLLPKKPTA